MCLLTNKGAQKSVWKDRMAIVCLPTILAQNISQAASPSIGYIHRNTQYVPSAKQYERPTNPCPGIVRSCEPQSSDITNTPQPAREVMMENRLKNVRLQTQCWFWICSQTSDSLQTIEVIAPNTKLLIDNNFWLRRQGPECRLFIDMSCVASRSCRIRDSVHQTINKNR